MATPTSASADSARPASPAPIRTTTLTDATVPRRRACPGRILCKFSASIAGSQFELAHVLASETGRWRVFLSERGGESDAMLFDSEHEACIALFGRVCLELAERGR